MASVQTQADRTEKLANGMHYALFGLPEDKTNNGLVGTMSELKAGLAAVTSELHITVSRVLVGLLVAVGADLVGRAFIR